MFEKKANFKVTEKSLDRKLTTELRKVSLFQRMDRNQSFRNRVAWISIWKIQFLVYNVDWQISGENHVEINQKFVEYVKELGEVVSSGQHFFVFSEEGPQFFSF